MTFLFSCIFYLYLLQQSFCVHPFHKGLTTLVSLNTVQRQKVHHDQNKKPFFASNSLIQKNHLEDTINFKRLHNANLFVPRSKLTSTKELNVSFPALNNTFSKNRQKYLQQLNDSSLKSNKAQKDKKEEPIVKQTEKEARSKEDEEAENSIKQSEKLEEERKKRDDKVTPHHEKEKTTDNINENRETQASVQESITNRSLTLANQAECLNNNIKNLEEELKNINEHNLKSDKEDETKESLEKEQMEVKRIRNKLMESKNAEEKAEELEDNYSSDLDVELKEAEAEMSKRKENHNLEMKKKEDELKQKQKELDCQTNEALKELNLEDTLPQEDTDKNFEDRSDDLKKKEAIATSEGDLANIQAEALVENTIEIGKLIKKTETVLSNAEKDYTVLMKMVENNSAASTADISCDNLKNFEAKLQEIRIQENILNDAVLRAKEALKKMDKLQDESETLENNEETVIKNAKDNSCADADHKFEDAKQETASTKDKITQFSSEINRLQTRLTDLEGKLDTSQSTIEQKNEEVAKIKEKCQNEELKSKSSLSDSCPPTKQIKDTSTSSEEENVLDREQAEAKENHEISSHREML